MKNTRDFNEMKNSKEKIAMVTAYDAPGGRYAEKADADIILVGDSLGMVVLGYESTIPVTVEDMIHHTKAVKRGTSSIFTVTDLPYMSYHLSKKDTMKNARRVMQEAGADAVKIEGGSKSVMKTIRKLVEAGVPVVAHLGLTPQSVAVEGGYFVKAKSEEEQKTLEEMSIAAEKNGAMMLVLECVPEGIAQKISKSLTIPVIGIGAGRYTDGQVLVYHDILGLSNGKTPKFVKTYQTLSANMEEGLSSFVREVKASTFPAEKHVFRPLDTSTALYGEKRP